MLLPEISLLRSLTQDRSVLIRALRRWDLLSVPFTETSAWTGCPSLPHPWPDWNRWKQIYRERRTRSRRDESVL